MISALQVATILFVFSIFALQCFTCWLWDWVLDLFRASGNSPPPPPREVEPDFTDKTHWLPYRPPKGREAFHFRHSIHSVRKRFPS